MKSQTLFTKEIIKSIFSICCFGIFLLSSSQMNAQCTLSCVDRQISVNGDCMAEITPERILSDPGPTPGSTSDCDYRVTITDLDDNFVAETEIIGSGIGTMFVHPSLSMADGKDFKVSISYTDDDGVDFSCWSFLTLEDKLSPTVACLDDVTVACTREFQEDLKSETSQSQTADETEDIDLADGNYSFCINIANEAFPWELISTATIDLTVLPTTVDESTLIVTADGPDGTTYPATYGTTDFSLATIVGEQATDLILNGKWTITIAGLSVTEVSSATLAFSSTSVFLDSPELDDNCSEEVEFEFLIDQTVDVDCEDQTDPICAFNRVISYRAIDESGNISPTCDFTICFNKPSINSVDFVFPENVTLMCEVVDTDGDGIPDTNFSSWDTNGNGYPDPGEPGIGYPSIDGKPLIPGEDNLCKISVAFEDTRIAICGNASFKLLRRWTILDWCESESRTWIQTIKIEDEQPPFLVCPPDTLTFEVGASECFGDVVFEPLNFSSNTGLQFLYDCSEVTMQVEILTADDRDVNDVDQPFNPTIDNQDGTFTAVDVQAGLFWIKYIATDGCGNMTECRFEGIMKDRTAPLAVCDQFTAVALSEDGWARANAISFDDGSYDGCGGELIYEVRRPSTPCSSVDGYDRNDRIFGPYAQFCCVDAAEEYVQVELRVTDECGNSSTCMVNVQVQDKFGPFIDQCPEPTVTIPCREYDADNLYGTPSIPSVTDNCVDPISPKYEDSANIDDSCEIGTVTRRWFYELGDSKIFLEDCTQIFTIGSDFNGIINFPNDKTIDCTAVGNNDIPRAGSELVTEYTGCANLAYTFEDQRFFDVDNICFKIRRTHTVIDWCVYEPNSLSNAGFYQDVQIIKVTNNAEPTIQECAMEVSQSLDDATCNNRVRLNVPWGYDDCIDAPILPEDMAYNIVSNGQIVEEVASINTTDGTITLQPLPKGTHQANFFIYNTCDNVATCTLDIVITETDTINPTPYCLGGITTVVMNQTQGGNPTVEIWANDFNLGSTDNCTDSDDLIYTFENGSQFMDFDCTELGIHSLDVYVIDECGNSDFCTTSIIIQANGDICDTVIIPIDTTINPIDTTINPMDTMVNPMDTMVNPMDTMVNPMDTTMIDSNNARILIAGSVFTENEEMLEELEILLNSMENGSFISEDTDIEGHYLFDDMIASDDYMVEPKSAYDFLNGVSTLDIVVIQRHILGLETLDSPYKIIAADVNNSETVSAIDLLQIRKLILGVETSFENTNSWRFVDSEFVFADENSPWPFTEQIELNDLAQNTMTNDFVAVKMGDVTSDASVSLLDNGNVESRGVASFTAENQEFDEGESISINMTPSFENLLGLQFALNFDFHMLKFEGIESSSFALSKDNYHVKSPGILVVSWSNAKLQTMDSDLVLRFTTLKNGSISESSLSFVDDVLKAEYYSSTSNSQALDLNIKNPLTQIDELRLLQNNPNPFSESTDVSFYLPSAADATINLLDLSGKLIYSMEGSFNKGLNQVNIKSEAINGQGLIYYQLDTEFGTETKKMLLIK